MQKVSLISILTEADDFYKCTTLENQHVNSNITKKNSAIAEIVLTSLKDKRINQ